MATESPDPADLAALHRQIAELQAKAAALQSHSSGALAQGGATALGQSAVQVAHDNTGTIITGTQIIQNYHPGDGSPLSKGEIARQVTGYLHWLRERTQSIELRGIERAGGAPVVMLPLETAYVSLRARPLPRPDDLAKKGGSVAVDMRRGRRGVHRSAEPDEHETDVALNQVLSLGHRLVIVGGPGCGKTTVLLHMAWALASSLLGGQGEPARSRLGLALAPDALPLPVFVPLASFARYRRHLPANAPAREKTLAHFISHHLISKQADFNLPADFFVQLLREGRHVILLLDGLDEVAHEGERAEVRQSVEELVTGRPQMRAVVTCRTVAYRHGRTALGAAFREIAVQPLDAEEHIAPMVQQAYQCIHPHDAALRAERCRDLLEGIERLEHDRRDRLGDEAEPLVSSPLMVRLLLIVHVNNRRLPDERADLFDKAINALLQVDYGREEGDIRELSTDWRLFRDMAQHLAYYMHAQGPDQGREIDEGALVTALRREDEFKSHVEPFLSHARQRGSVIEERDGAYRFIHLAFQEFLVARGIREVAGAEGRDALVNGLQLRLEDPWWREPVLLLAGYMAVRAAKPARDFIAQLGQSGATPNARFCAAELAGRAALEWRESGVTLRGACAGRICDLLGNAHTLLAADAAARARAGDALAALGDPRFDPDRFHLPADDALGFVRIAADPDFVIGTRKADAKRVEKIIGEKVGNDEFNSQPTPTPEFLIARYPVTVAQFRAFVEATGREPGDPSALKDPASRPVRYVDWHEAAAYCDWLTGTLARSPALAGCRPARLVREQGWVVALPNEPEWEKAARGGLAGAVFPWGDSPDPQRANYDVTGIGTTCAVGCFPANGYGLHDMVGNVWEWTRSVWGEYPYPVDDPAREDLRAPDDVERVVRGGSWSGSRVSARCACRYGNLPGYRDLNLGFRVVLRSSPVLSKR